MLTHELLLEAGFKSFPPNAHFDNWDQGYQFRVRDEKGTRYFVDVMRWDHWKHRQGDSIPTGWEVELRFNEASNFHPQCALIVKAYSTVDKWTPQDVLNWADGVWQRLKPDYYELDGE